MTITASSKIRDVARDIPASLVVFERYGVDFCCGGDRPLSEAVQGTKLSVGDLIAEIEAAAEAQQGEDSLHEDWSRYSPAGLTRHIEQAHHEYLREELPKAGAALAKVIQVHGDRHSELFDLGRVFQRLRNDLLAHLEREETVIFPAIRDSLGEGTPGEEAEEGALGPPPPELLDWLDGLEADHDVAGGLLQEMRRIADGYGLPEDACATYGGLYETLAALEADIHRHVHLENNILIPEVREALARLASS